PSEQHGLENSRDACHSLRGHGDTRPPARRRPRRGREDPECRGASRQPRSPTVAADGGSRLHLPTPPGPAVGSLLLAVAAGAIVIGYRFALFLLTLYTI